MNLPFEEIIEQNKEILSRLTAIEDIIKKQPIKMYSPEDISDNTPLSTQTVLAAIKDGRIKAQRFGRKYLITAEEFNNACCDAEELKYKRRYKNEH